MRRRAGLTAGSELEVQVDDQGSVRLVIGAPSRDALPLLDAVARGRIRSPRTAWQCCLEVYFDAHIAEIARSARASVVVTDNQRDFAVLERHGIPVLTAVGLRARLPSRRQGA